MALNESFLEGPMIPPPSGVTPDFDHLDGNHAFGYFIVIIGGVLAFIAVLIRLVSSYAWKNIKLKDVLLVCALGLYAGYLYSLYDVAIFAGVGVHQWDFQLKDLERFLQDIHLSFIFYNLSIMCLKLAILVDWMQIFIVAGQRSAMFWTFHILIWSNLIYYVSTTGLEIFQSYPHLQISGLSFTRPTEENTSYSVDLTTHSFVATVINMISDIAILVLPQWTIWNLNMSNLKKIGISLLFVIGIFAVACGIARLVSLRTAVDSLDVVFHLTNVGYWGIGEITAGFLVIGIPSVPKLTKGFTNFIRSWIHSSLHDSNPSRRGLSSWHRPVLRERRGPWSISELETSDPVSMGTMNHTAVPPRTIVWRDQQIDVAIYPSCSEDVERTAYTL